MNFLNHLDKPSTRPNQTANIKPLQAATKPLTKPLTNFATNPLTKPMTSAEPLTKPMTNFTQMSNQTPGGLNGNINNQAYNKPPYGTEPPQQTQPWQSASYGGGSVGGAFGGNGGAQGFGNFDQFRDSALEQAMRTLRPEMDSNNSAFEQMMVSRGIDPSNEQYQSQRSSLDRRNNDMLNQATYGAQQQGLAAQNQAFNQDYQYDALANALSQARIGANASMANANTSANASMYNSDNNLAASQMANSLGYDRLNQQGREFDINDIFRTNQQDINAGLGWGNLDLQQQSQNLQNWQANQGAQNNWWNQISGMMNNAPGVNFNPTGDFVGNTMRAGQNQQNNTNQANAALATLLGGGASMIPWSDKRLKENIEFVETINGVNVYDFDYIDKSLGADRYRGVIAQEVKETHPEAISEISGFMMVDYSKLPINMSVIEKKQEVA